MIEYLLHQLSDLKGITRVWQRILSGDHRGIIWWIYPGVCPPGLPCRAQLTCERCPPLPSGRTLPVGDTAGGARPRLSASGLQWSASPRCQSCSRSYGSTESRVNARHERHFSWNPSFWLRTHFLDFILRHFNKIFDISMSFDFLLLKDVVPSEFLWLHRSNHSFYNQVKLIKISVVKSVQNS